MASKVIQNAVEKSPLNRRKSLIFNETRLATDELGLMVCTKLRAFFRQASQGVKTFETIPSLQGEIRLRPVFIYS